MLYNKLLTYSLLSIIDMSKDNINDSDEDPCHDSKEEDHEVVI